MKAVITRWLSHGEACKPCTERYHIIIEALDITSTTNNLELLTYRNTLLDSEAVYQITFDRQRLKEIEGKLSLITEKVHNPLSVEDLLQDSVIETAFPSI